jgi:hypothetical protein
MADQPNTELTKENEIVGDVENLRHMLGVASNIHKRDWGYRNYYNTSDSGPACDSMKRLQALGLVVPGHRNYWHATKSGCKVAGLSDKQTERALNDN